MYEYVQQGNPTNTADEIKIIYWERTISGSEQLVLLTKGNKKERERKEIEHFSNKASFSNIPLIAPIYNWPALAIYAGSFTVKRNIMKF